MYTLFRADPRIFMDINRNRAAVICGWRREPLAVAISFPSLLSICFTLCLWIPYIMKMAFSTTWKTCCSSGRSARLLSSSSGWLAGNNNNVGTGRRLLPEWLLAGWIWKVAVVASYTTQCWSLPRHGPSPTRTMAIGEIIRWGSWRW